MQNLPFHAQAVIIRNRVTFQAPIMEPVKERKSKTVMRKNHQTNFIGCPILLLHSTHIETLSIGWERDSFSCTAHCYVVLQSPASTVLAIFQKECAVRANSPCQRPVNL